METLGIIIEKDGKFTISGDCFVEAAPNIYQILRSTYFSLLWNENVKYKIYIIKYPVINSHYHSFAHKCLNNGDWKKYIFTVFDLYYSRYNADSNDNLDCKLYTIISNDQIWKITFNIFHIDNMTTISLPYLRKC
jgi:hypothetical protein